MITCTFAGHRQIPETGIGDRIYETLVKFIKTDNEFVFLNGGMGRFDEICASVVRRLKRCYPEKKIRLCLVAAYFSNKFNTEKNYYQELFDEILIPEEAQNAHRKAAITKRNRWMVEQSDVILVYINHDYGGAYQTFKYANKKAISIINFAESVTE